MVTAVEHRFGPVNRLPQPREKCPIFGGYNRMPVIVRNFGHFDETAWGISPADDPAKELSNTPELRRLHCDCTRIGWDLIGSRCCGID